MEELNFYLFLMYVGLVLLILVCYWFILRRIRDAEEKLDSLIIIIGNLVHDIYGWKPVTGTKKKKVSE